MFIGGMTNEHIKTGLPNAFFVLWLPLGPQWKQCCSPSNTHMLPDACEAKKQELSALLVSVPPPPVLHSYKTCRQTEQVQTARSVFLPLTPHLSSRQNQSALPTTVPAGLIRGSSVCKLSEQHIYQHNTQCTQPKYLQRSHSAAAVNTQRKNVPCMKLELQFMKTRRLWLVDPVTHPGLHPGEKKEAV